MSQCFVIEIVKRKMFNDFIKKLKIDDEDVFDYKAYREAKKELNAITLDWYYSSEIKDAFIKELGYFEYPKKLTED